MLWDPIHLDNEWLNPLLRIPFFFDSIVDDIEKVRVGCCFSGAPNFIKRGIGAKFDYFFFINIVQIDARHIGRFIVY